MSTGPAYNATIAGVGAAQGGRVVTSAELGERYGLTGDWIVDRTGVRERRWLAEGQTLADLIDSAARDALEMASVKPADIELVLVATVSPDDQLPAQSVVAAKRLGIPETAVTADVNAACTGFVTALSHAAAMVESGRIRVALVCGADALSRVIDYDDPKSAPLFGDGAGAVVVTRAQEGKGWIGPVTGGHDEHRPALYMNIEEKNVIKMRGRDVYAAAVQRICEATRLIVQEAGLTLDELDLLVAHQANIRIIEAVGDKLGLREDQVMLAIEDVGNTSAASIPIALTRAAAAGRLEHGARAVLVGFGGGFVWSAIYVEMGPLPVMSGNASAVASDTAPTDATDPTDAPNSDSTPTENKETVQ
jgi:3-oxoacyl-[acyl-carrier-protein] synthase-3